MCHAAVAIHVTASRLSADGTAVIFNYVVSDGDGTPAGSVLDYTSQSAFSGQVLTRVQFIVSEYV